jgi:uncharacterized membrane protein YphA (DoxX/SURF4 family)
MTTRLVFALRCIIAFIFIVSGMEKLLSPAENFHYLLKAYQIIPDRPAMLVALVFPWLEMVMGVFLLLGLWLRPTLAMVMLVSLGFMTVVGQAILRDLPIDSCGCFGNMVHLPLRQVICLDLSIFAGAFVCVRRLEEVRWFSLDRYCDPTVS